MHKKIEPFLFNKPQYHIPLHSHSIYNPSVQINSIYANNMSAIILNQELSDIVVPNEPKVQRKRRTVEEIAAANAEKEQKKQEREEKRIQVQQKAEEAAIKRQQLAIRKEQHSTALVPGTSIFAIAAMTILGLCSKNIQRTNLAFRQMFASRLIFPPKKNINKFATGGIAEECVSQLFCDVGLVCNNLSEDANVIDLEIQVPIINSACANENVPLKVSLKNSGKIASPPILENYRGQKRPEIRALPPTFIIYTEVDIKRARIVYLDDEILRQGYPGLSDEEFNAEIYTNSDSNLTFKSGFLPKFIPRLPAEYILTADYPEDLTGLGERNFSKLALAEVIKQLDSTK